jgi:hypothetical protein
MVKQRPSQNILTYANVLNVCDVTFKTDKLRSGKHEISTLRNFSCEEKHVKIKFC